MLIYLYTYITTATADMHNSAATIATTSNNIAEITTIKVPQKWKQCNSLTNNPATFFFACLQPYEWPPSLAGSEASWQYTVRTSVRPCVNASVSVAANTAWQYFKIQFINAFVQQQIQQMQQHTNNLTSNAYALQQQQAATMA